MLREYQYLAALFCSACFISLVLLRRARWRGDLLHAEVAALLHRAFSPRKVSRALVFGAKLLALAVIFGPAAIGAALVASCASAGLSLFLPCVWWLLLASLRFRALGGMPSQAAWRSVLGALFSSWFVLLCYTVALGIGPEGSFESTTASFLALNSIPIVLLCFVNRSELTRNVSFLHFARQRLFLAEDWSRMVASNSSNIHVPFHYFVADRRPISSFLRFIPVYGVSIALLGAYVGVVVATESSARIRDSLVVCTVVLLIDCMWVAHLSSGRELQSPSSWCVILILSRGLLVCTSVHWFVGCSAVFILYGTWLSHICLRIHLPLRFPKKATQQRTELLAEDSLRGSTLRSSTLSAAATIARKSTCKGGHRKHNALRMLDLSPTPTPACLRWMPWLLSFVALLVAMTAAEWHQSWSTDELLIFGRAHPVYSIGHLALLFMLCAGATEATCRSYMRNGKRISRRPVWTWLAVTQLLLTATGTYMYFVSELALVQASLTFMPLMFLVFDYLSTQISALLREAERPRSLSLSRRWIRLRHVATSSLLQLALLTAAIVDAMALSSLATIWFVSAFGIFVLASHLACVAVLRWNHQRRVDALLFSLCVVVLALVVGIALLVCKGLERAAFTVGFRNFLVNSIVALVIIFALTVMSTLFCWWSQKPFFMTTCLFLISLAVCVGTISTAFALGVQQGFVALLCFAMASHFSLFCAFHVSKLKNASLFVLLKCSVALALIASVAFMLHEPTSASWVGSTACVLGVVESVIRVRCNHLLHSQHGARFLTLPPILGVLPGFVYDAVTDSLEPDTSYGVVALVFGVAGLWGAIASTLLSPMLPSFMCGLLALLFSMHFTLHVVVGADAGFRQRCFTGEISKLALATALCEAAGEIREFRLTCALHRNIRFKPWAAHLVGAKAEGYRIGNACWTSIDAPAFNPAVAIANINHHQWRLAQARKLCNRLASTLNSPNFPSPANGENSGTSFIVSERESASRLDIACSHVLGRPRFNGSPNIASRTSLLFEIDREVERLENEHLRCLGRLHAKLLVACDSESLHSRRNETSFITSMAADSARLDRVLSLLDLRKEDSRRTMEFYRQLVLQLAENLNKGRSLRWRPGFPSVSAPMEAHVLHVLYKADSAIGAVDKRRAQMKTVEDTDADACRQIAFLHGGAQSLSRTESLRCAIERREPSIIDPMTGLFTDPEFSATGSSVVPLYRKPRTGSSLSKLSSIDDLVWLRGAKLAQKEGLMSCHLDPTPTHQGALGDCWLLNALSIVARTRPDLVRALFVGTHPETDIRDGGFCHVRLFIRGQWRHVIIDDLLPCSHETQRPVFACGDTDIGLCIPLLEKAYAKLHGSYCSLEGGLVHVALSELTAGHAFEIHLDDLVNTSTVCFWSRMKEYLHLRCLLGAGSPSGTSAPAKDGKIHQGIITGLAYTVLDIRMVGPNDVWLIQLGLPMNVVSVGRWNGDWSEESPLWTAGIRRELGVAAFKPGTFWMSFDDFLDHFETVYVCHVPDDPRGATKSFEGAWRGDSAGGAPTLANRICSSCNPKYRIRVSQKVRVRIFLSQEVSLIRQGEPEGRGEDLHHHNTRSAPLSQEERCAITIQRFFRLICRKTLKPKMQESREGITIYCKARGAGVATSQLEPHRMSQDYAQHTTSLALRSPASLSSATDDRNDDSKIPDPQQHQLFPHASMPDITGTSLVTDAEKLLLHEAAEAMDEECGRLSKQEPRPAVVVPTVSQEAQTRLWTMELHRERKEAVRAAAQRRQVMRSLSDLDVSGRPKDDDKRRSLHLKRLKPPRITTRGSGAGSPVPSFMRKSYKSQRPPPKSSVTSSSQRPALSPSFLHVTLAPSVHSPSSLGSSSSYSICDDSPPSELIRASVSDLAPCGKVEDWGSVSDPFGAGRSGDDSMSRTSHAEEHRAELRSNPVMGSPWWPLHLRCNMDQRDVGGLHYIGIFLCEEIEASTILGYSGFWKKREVSLEVSLQPGTYVIIPCAYQAGAEANFKLSIVPKSKAMQVIA